MAADEEHEDVVGPESEAEEKPPMKKRAKRNAGGGRPKTRYSSIVDLGGNAMNLADLGSVLLPAILCADIPGLFQHSPDELDHVSVSLDGDADNDILIDHTSLDYKAMRAMKKVDDGK